MVKETKLIDGKSSNVFKISKLKFRTDSPPPYLTPAFFIAINQNFRTSSQESTIYHTLINASEIQNPGTTEVLNKHHVVKDSLQSHEGNEYFSCPSIGLSSRLAREQPKHNYAKLSRSGSTYFVDLKPPQDPEYTSRQMFMKLS